MKILWFSNSILSKTQSKGSGSWLFAMRDLLSDHIDLINVTDGIVKTPELNRGNGIKEYILPRWPLKNRVPSKENISIIEKIVIDEKPDIIHIWGTEKYWALLFSRGVIDFHNVIIEMQGVISSCVDVFYGGLTPQDYRKMVSLKSILKPSTSLHRCLGNYQKKMVDEYEVVSKFKYISTQSEWTRGQLITICRHDAKFLHTLRPIRKEFINAEKWHFQDHLSPVLFCSFSYYVPFKGFHILLRALNELKIKYPDIKLKIAGPNILNKPFYSLTDYERYLVQYIRKHKLLDNISFLGMLNAAEIIKELHEADVAVNPSFVESYSAAAAESLYLGVPTVLAYAGAMVDFSSERQVALYYNPLDYRALTAKILQFWGDTCLRSELTNNSIMILSDKCDPERVCDRQLELYKKVITENH